MHGRIENAVEENSVVVPDDVLVAPATEVENPFAY
jgi:hypothetical protein